MNVATMQPIAGVSASHEADIEAVYPSIARGLLGQLIGIIMGTVYAAIPVNIIRFPLMVVVGAAMIPFALLGYALRLLGTCFIITNRSVQEQTILGKTLVKQLALSEIDNIEIEVKSSYVFHHVGDVNLLNAQGQVLMSIPAIANPERLRQILFDARNARVQSDQALATINRRE